MIQHVVWLAPREYMIEIRHPRRVLSCGGRHQRTICECSCLCHVVCTVTHYIAVTDPRAVRHNQCLLQGFAHPYEQADVVGQAYVSPRQLLKGRKTAPTFGSSIN